MIEEELDRLRVIADMVFNDETSEKCEYEDFMKALGFCFKNVDFNPEEAFKEMLGKEKSYFTLRTLIKAYLKFKRSPNDLSKNLQKFLEFMVGQTVKLREEELGVPKQGQKRVFNTAKCKNRKYVSKIEVFLDDNQCPGGFSLEYDGFFNMPLYDKSNENLTHSEKIEFECLEDQELLQLLQDKVNSENEFLLMDSVTQVYGTFQDKIQFIGFNFRSGKKKEFGNPIGEPFIYGHPERQFHGIKFETSKEDGISFFVPFFTKTRRFNHNTSISLNDITDEYLKKEEVFDKEKGLKKAAKKSIEYLEKLLKNEEYTNGKNEKQKDGKSEKQKDGKSEKQKDEKSEKQKDEKSEKQKDEKSEKQKDEKEIVTQEDTIQKEKEADKKVLLRGGKKTKKEDKNDEVFLQEPDALDDDGEVNQYYLRTDKGYIFGIENKTKFDYEMELETGGFKIVEPEIYEGQSNAKFILKKRSRNTFVVSPIPKYKGKFFFQFNSE
jgi:hypothetical protein